MKTIIADVSKQLDEGQEKQGKGIDIQPDNINIKDINDFVKFKILEYKVANLKDNDIQEVYKDDFKDFITKIFKKCNQISIQKL